MHPAITRAAMIYDEPRDMEPHEQAFLTAVHKITRRDASKVGDARRLIGNHETLLNAVKFRLDADLADELTGALERYDAAIAAADEGLECELAAVADVMQAAE